MDFVSLDILPKEPTFETSSSIHAPFYKSNIFKAIAIILFVSILCFPQPEWLITMLSHPVGALALASFVSLALLPELEWWVIIIAVCVTYLLFAITGLIESNLETRRKKIEDDSKQKAKDEQEASDDINIQEYMEPSQMSYRESMPPMGPVASNQGPVAANF